MTKHLHERGIALIIFFLILAYLPIIAADNASAQSCSGSWTITDTSWAKTNYQIGETISGSISFEISNLADCPRCTQQILIALIDSQNYIVDWKCIYDDIPQVCPPYETTGKVDITLRNPNYPGTYRIVATNEKQSSCSDAFLYGDYYPKMTTGQQMYLATITVAASNSINEPTVPTSPPLPTPKKEDTATGSSGSGTPQNAGTFTTGVSTHLIIIVAALLGLLFLFSIIGTKSRRGFLKVILVLAVVSFCGYLLWIYGIPLITNWFRQNIGTILTLVLVVSVIAIVVLGSKKGSGGFSRRLDEFWRWLKSLFNPPPPAGLSFEEFENYIKNMHWRAFELYIGDLLRKMSFQDVIVTQASADHGIDVKAHKQDELGIQSDYIIQCKLYQNSRVGEPDITQLFGNMQSTIPHPKGIVVSPSGFTKAAIGFAQKCGMALWDINFLYELYKKSSGNRN